MNCIGNHDDPKPAVTGLVCVACRNRISSLLVRLPDLEAWLIENQAAGGNTGQPKVSGSREDPIPLRVNILDYIGPTSSREISRTMTLLGSHFRACPAEQYGEPSFLDVIGSWCLLVSEEHGDGWPARNDLASLCRWLQSQLDWIVNQAWVSEMLENLADMTRNAERLAPREPEHRWLQNATCPSCDLRALVFTRGIGVKCEKRMGGCGRDWTDDDYERLIVVLGHAAMEAS